MAIPFMDSDNDIIEFDGLIYERTDDMSVLSDFRCGIYDMDAFIHNHLQTAISTNDLETYLVKQGNEILAVFSICDNVLKSKLSSGEHIDYNTREIEYLAVRKDRQHGGIGRSIIKLIVDRLMHNRSLLSVSAYMDVDTKYTAEPFYEKCGFHRIGGPLHPMAECVRMLRYLE